MKMIESGFLDEVEILRNNKKLSLDLASMRCVGYRQAWKYFDGIYDMQEMIDKAVIASRQLSKRQCTWLKDENNALVLKNANFEEVIKFLQ